MADESYVIPEEPVYHAAIRKILNEDPVNADGILNPLIQALLENIHFVKLLAQAKAENSALDAHTGDDTAHLTAEERTVWNGKAAGDHRHTAADVGARPSTWTPSAADVGAVPTSRKVNGKALSADISLSAADVSARSSTWTPSAADVGAIPTNQKGVANGVATLGTDSKIPSSQLPAMNYIPTSQKASANGVATLGSDAKVPKSQLPDSEGKRTARFTVGTSTAGWTADQVDYLCDGTADQVEINAAITALPSTGGEVIILDGTYNLTGSINVNKNNVTLSGNGQSTILKRVFGGTSHEQSMIYVNSSNSTIKFLSLDGVRGTYTNVMNDGIFLFNCSDNIIICNTVSNCAGPGIYAQSTGTSSYNNTITGNICKNNKDGIRLYRSIKNNITGNICNGNTTNGISTNLSDDKNVIAGNTVNDNETGISFGSGSNNVITGNTCDGNSNRGIYLNAGANNNAITGNIFNNNGTGILIYSKNNTISGNTIIRNNGATSDYTTSQNTIDVRGNNNLIVGNNIMGKNYTNSGTGNTFADNKYAA